MKILISLSYISKFHVILMEANIDQQPEELNSEFINDDGPLNTKLIKEIVHHLRISE